MKKSKILILILVICLVFILSFQISHNYRNGKEDNLTQEGLTEDNLTEDKFDKDPPQLGVSISGPIRDKDQLFEESDLIAQIKILNMKERGTRIIETDPEKGSYAYEINQKIKVHAPVIVYEAEIVDIIKGNEKSKKIDLVLPDMSIESSVNGLKNPVLDLNESYFAFLYQNIYYGEKAYSLSSFSNNFYKISSNNTIIDNEKEIALDKYKKSLIQ